MSPVDAMVAQMLQQPNHLLFPRVGGGEGGGYPAGRGALAAGLVGGIRQTGPAPPGRPYRLRYVCHGLARWLFRAFSALPTTSPWLLKFVKGF